MRATRSFVRGAALAGLVSIVPGAARAQTAPPAPVVDSVARDEARAHFELGLAHFDRGEYGAALAEFLRSRALFPTRAATRDAILCLRKENRFDEALDLVESFTREFPDLSDTDRAFAAKEERELRASVGALDVRSTEAGASVVIDGRARGVTPLAGPLRVGAGGHVVRVFREGFRPFEARIDLAGGETSTIDAGLQALAESGRLRVNEQSGRAVDVLVDNVVVGRTPWEGTLAVGDHTVLLRGEGARGTQAAAAPVTSGRLTTLNLATEELTAIARIEPVPASAIVALDGVVLGRGVWEGRLRAGRHTLEATAEGFVPSSPRVTFAAGERRVVPLELERDPTSPAWGARNPARFTIDVTGAPAIASLFGGDVVAHCTGVCTRSPALGALVMFRGGYQFPSGLGVTLDAGYFALAKDVRGRAAAIAVRGLPSNLGSADDELRVKGVRLGAAGAFHRGARFPFTLRLGAGVLLGSVRDARSGSFVNGAGQRYDVDVSETARATYLYFEPGVRLGVRLGAHMEINAGVDALFLVGLAEPSWRDLNPVTTAPVPSSRGDGPGAFGRQTLAGSLLVVLAPGLGVRFEL
jgi:hypothetical protein